MRFQYGGFLPLAVIVLSAAAAAAAPLPLNAFGQLPALESVALSPDGKRYAAIVGDDTQAQIQVRSLADGKLISVSAVEKAKARSLHWAGSDHLLAMLSTTENTPGGFSGGRREWYQIQDIDLTTRTSRRLMDKVDDTMNVVTGAPMPVTIGGKPSTILPGFAFVYGRGNSIVGISGLYRVDLATAKTELVEKGTARTIDWVVDAAGVAVARADYDELQAEWTLFTRRHGGEWKKGHVETATIDLPQLLALGDDGASVIVRSRDTGDWSLHAVSIADGQWGPALTGIDPDGFVIDPTSRRLTATSLTDMDKVRYSFRSPDDQRSWDAIAKAFPDETVSLESWSEDRSVIVAHVQGRANGDGYFVINRRTREAKPLGSRYPGLPPAELGDRRAIHYKAGDGLEIAAYLTLPPGGRAKALALVVLPHGGPAARDDPGFDWWSQALASHGYAVLQPQFRGSDGFGDPLLQAGYGQWGRKMQSDLSDGVRHLAATGIIDPARVCIAGGSYGGYAALAGVTFESGVYRCASALAGVADIRMMLGGVGRVGARINPKRSLNLRFWLRYTGGINNGDPALDALSPARHADRIKVPVQLIHGKDDTVVPFEQSTAMKKAMLRAGGNVELVSLASEDHWLSRAQTRIMMLSAMLGFLERHNPPDTRITTAP